MMEIQGVTLRRNLHITQLLRRLEVSDQTFLIVVSVVVGLVVGAGSFVFEKLLEYSSFLFWELLPGWLGKSNIFVILTPFWGALLLAPFIFRFPKETSADGVPATMEAVALNNGFIRWTNSLLTMVTSALTLGSGGSAGSEGPIIRIGAALASGVGQFFRVSGNRLRIIVAAGAAAGLASIFNAPIAGVLFSLEVVLGEFNVHTFTPLIIASVVATAFSRAFIHHEPLLKLPTFSLSSPLEIPLYALMGVIAGLVSVAFTRTFHSVEQVFHHNLHLPKEIKPAIGGLSVGVIGLFYPQIFGYAYQPISQAINGDFVFNTLVALVILKIVATSLTLGSGGSGGVLCPSLFLGATLGSACGNLFHRLLPSIALNQGGYGVVGMGAMLGAAIQAPMTGIIMVFEMTNEYSVILPMMTSCTIAAIVHKNILRGSIYTLSLSKKGIDIEAGREVGILSSIQVRDVMENHVDTIEATASYEEIIQALLRGKNNYVYVVDENGNLEGVISFSDLKEFIFEDQLKDLIVARDVANPNVVWVSPDESLAASLSKFSYIDMDQLPVVQAVNGSLKIVGIITKSQLLKAYHREMQKRVLITTKKVEEETTQDKGKVSSSNSGLSHRSEADEIRASQTS